MSQIRIPQVKMRLGHKPEALKAEAAKILGLKPGDITGLAVERKSVDARDKGDIALVYAVVVDTSHKPQAPAQSRPRKGAGPGPKAYDDHVPDSPYVFPQTVHRFRTRPVVVGSGPAGLFAALMLAEAGHAPLVLERGDGVDERMAAVKEFHTTGKLDPESNIQFGEGGAGTFSDGKLTTMINDHEGRSRRILLDLVKAGAPREILETNKPHVGTDCLVHVVRNLRQRIIAAGGEVRFRSKVTGLLVHDGTVQGVRVNDEEEIATDTVILAVGHSARDVFFWLHRQEIPLEPKAFAMGVRIEHPQSMIGMSQFGKSWVHKDLPAADYKLASKTSDGRGVYTFCMCPGGWVVNASSEPGRVVCNGMSYQARDGANANAAVLVTVDTRDFPHKGVLAGMELQREWEEKAWLAGGKTHALPVQTFEDFAEARLKVTDLGKRKPAGQDGSAPFGPAIEGLWNPGRVDRCLPAFIHKGIVEGVRDFDRKVRGFARPDALITGIESRSSSPVRILRGTGGESDIRGLFPCGEGAGYAGGIMSAAMDGIKAAEAVVADRA